MTARRQFIFPPTPFGVITAKPITRAKDHNNPDYGSGDAGQRSGKQLVAAQLFDIGQEGHIGHEKGPHSFETSLNAVSEIGVNLGFLYPILLKPFDPENYERRSRDAANG